MLAFKSIEVIGRAERWVGDSGALRGVGMGMCSITLDREDLYHRGLEGEIFLFHFAIYAFG